MSRPYNVYGLGHALVDIQHTVSPEYLASQTIDKGVMTLIEAERQDSLLASLNQKPVTSASGGSAANTLIGIANFGGQAYYACQIGQDDWGDFYHSDLEAAGVGSNPALRQPGPTGKCLVFITPDADRTLNTFLGVSSQLGPDQLEEAIIRDSQYIYLEGYLLSSDNGFAACQKAQTLARKHSTLVSLTLSDPFMIEVFKERFEQLIDNGIDLLFCNEDEARAYTGAANRDEACRALTAAAAAVCITCGPDGAYLHQNGCTSTVPGVAVQAIDTTGAGDMFAGGVLFGVTNGYTLEQAAQLGSYAAAQVVARYGPRLDRPLKDQIPAILAHFA
jgi:sugar/nucleoside kinase (ribokinase family)